MPDVYDRIIMGGRTFEFPTGLERLRARLKDYFPAEAGAIDRYLAAVQSAQKASGLYFAEKAIPRPVARLAGRLLRAPFLRWASQTTLDVLHRFTQNEELIAVLTAQWGDYGLPPAQSSFGMHAIVAAHYFNGASYPVGGASRIAETIAPAIERNGGKVVVSADVQEIIVQNGKATGVRMADGREFHADLVISDAGARNTFQRLVREPQPSLQPVLKDLDRVPGSLAHLSLYMGVKQTARELGLNGTNLWIYPSGAHDANLARFIQDPSAPFPVVYISFPSAKDPEFERNHPGRATLEAVVFAPYEWFARWEDSRWKHRAAEYDAFKQGLGGSHPERSGAQRSRCRRQNRSRGTVHSAHHSPLHELPARRSLRTGRHARALSPALPHAAHAHPKSVPHWPGRRVAGRCGRSLRRCDDGVGCAGAQPHVDGHQTHHQTHAPHRAGCLDTIWPWGSNQKIGSGIGSPGQQPSSS